MNNPYDHVFYNGGMVFVELTVMNELNLLSGQPISFDTFTLIMQRNAGIDLAEAARIKAGE